MVNVHVPVSAIVYGPRKEILDLQLDVVKKNVPPRPRPNENGYGSQKLDPGKLQIRSKIPKVRTKKNTEPGTSYARSWRNE